MSPSEQPEIPEELLKGVLSGGSAVHFVSWDRYTTLGAGSAPFLLVEPVIFCYPLPTQSAGK